MDCAWIYDFLKMKTDCSKPKAETKQNIIFSFQRVLHVFAMILFLSGCIKKQEIASLRIDQVASQRYEIEDAVPVLEYKDSGIVVYLTRSGESGEINIVRNTKEKHSNHYFRQFGMPYQMQDTLTKLVSSSDKGIRVEDKPLSINDKGNHYSAYKSLWVDETKGSLLSATSDGIYLFERDYSGKYRETRLYPDPQDSLPKSIKEVRFLDLVKWDEDTYYAAGHAGILRINLKTRETASERGANAPMGVGISHLRVSREGSERTLLAYGENGLLYKKGDKTNAKWTNQTCIPGVIQSFVESEEHREWLIRFDQATEVWEDRGESSACVAYIVDEQPSGMRTLNDRIHFCAVDAQEYGYVLARGRFIYVIPKHAVLLQSEPVLSACFGDNDRYIYCKAGIHGKYSGLYRVDISGKRFGDVKHLRDMPTYAHIIGIKDGRAIIQAGDLIQEVSLKQDKVFNEKRYERLVQARMDPNREILVLTQNELLAYGDTLDNRKAGVDQPSDYYPQTFLPLAGGNNPEVCISTIHEGVLVLKKDDKGKWNRLTVNNNHYFLRGPDYDPVILMTQASDRYSNLIYLCTQEGHLFQMSRSMEEGWDITPFKNEEKTLPVRIDEMAADSSGFYGLNYFSRGLMNLSERDISSKEVHLKINNLCTVPGKGIVYSCQEGLYCNWINTQTTRPISINVSSFWEDFGLNKTIVFVVGVMLLVLAAVSLTMLYLKRKKKQGIRAEQEKKENKPDSCSSQDFDIKWQELTETMEGIDARYLQQMRKVITKKLGESRKCCCETCDILMKEKLLIEKYFKFVSAMETIYKEEKCEEKTLEELNKLYDAFYESIHLTPSAAEDFRAIGIKDRQEQKQVRSYFLLPIKCREFRSDSLPDWVHSFKFASVVSHYSAISSYRNSNGAFSPGLNKWLNSCLRDGKGLGLITIIGLWTTDQINPAELKDSDD